MDKLSTHEETVLEKIAEGSSYGEIIAYASETDTEASEIVDSLEEQGYVDSDGGIDIHTTLEGEKYIETDPDNFDELHDAYKIALAYATTSASLQDFAEYRDQKRETLESWINKALNINIIERSGLDIQLAENGEKLIEGRRTQNNGTAEYNSSYWDSLIKDIEKRKKELENPGEPGSGNNGTLRDRLNKLFGDQDRVLLSQASSELGKPEEEIRTNIQEEPRLSNFTLKKHTGVNFLEQN